MSYGFILTRHVNSAKTNEYWNHCIKLIRTNYPLKKIIIIDDNSNYSYVKAHFEYTNVEIIQSEFPGRGELLPFYYFIRNKWFDNAVIIHDSVFFHTRIPFETFRLPVLSLWHSVYDKENLPNIMRIVSQLRNNTKLRQELIGSDVNILGMTEKTLFNLSFGNICYINHNFLLNIERKYNLSNLVNALHSRADRCSLERIMGLLFDVEYSNTMTIKSLFGNIYKTHYKSFNYTYDEYIRDFKNKKLAGGVVKIWTGR